MDKAITTTLLILAGVVCMIFVFSNVFPMINRSSQTLVSMADNLDNTMETSISIVQASASSNRETIYIWVKNVGNSTISSIEQSDLFFGPENDFSRIPYVDYAGGQYPQWQYEIENDTQWNPMATIRITITYTADPGSGTYYVKLIIPNGTVAEYYFSM